MAFLNKYLICLVLVVLVVKVLLHIVPRNVTREPHQRDRTLNITHHVLGPEAKRENFYITKPQYKSRLHPQYCDDKENWDRYQLGAYHTLGELGRRYKAKYLIDVGCGNARKSASYQYQFNVIGMDYEINLATAKRLHPQMTFVEANLDINGSCTVDLHPDVLSQAVIVAADVIEHIVDPFYCFTKLLKQWSEDAYAIIISSPDRLRMRGSNHTGPPSNSRHVREWTNEELEVLLLEEGMYPMYNGQVCGSYGSCQKGFTPNNLSKTTQIHLLANSKVLSIWLSEPRIEPQVTAFIIMRQNTQQALLDYNVNYLTTQGIQVVILAVGQRASRLTSQKSVYSLPSFEDVPKYITNHINNTDYSEMDWFIIMEAHEVISFPQSPALNLTLKEALTRIGLEPYGFNAVALSTFFMVDKSGQPHPSWLPFKMFAFGGWSGHEDEHLWPGFDTTKHRVRIWKKSSFPLSFVQIETLSGHSMVGDVHFVGRNVYPYHALSLRFHPTWKEPFTWLDDKLRQIYGLQIALGYLESSQKSVLSTDRYLY